MANSANNLSLRSVLEKDKLTGINFLDWYRNLRIVLKQERKFYVLEQPIPQQPEASAPKAERDAYKKHYDDALDVGCLMLATMNSELQKQHENMEAYDMLEHLKKLYQGQARYERYDISKALFSCKLAEGSPVGPHVLKMIGYIENLGRLGFPLSQELATDVILQSLPQSYNHFIMNYNMNEIDKSLPELLSMLRTAEQNLQKSKPSAILMVQKGKGKKKVKGKGKITRPKPTPRALRPKGGVEKEGECFYCHKPGHWRRNCSIYLEDLKRKKGSEASTSGIYVIEVNVTTSTSWVLDTGCGSHICNNVQELKRSRNLAKGEVDLRVGNGARVAAIAVGIYSLELPSGLIIELKDCYYVPSIIRNIISISCLDKEGFSFVIKDNGCSVYLNEILYCRAQLFNGLYILDLEPHVYNINTKRIKSNDLNPTYLWHCRLGHINEKRISKLHKNGLLNSFDFESYEVCESCLLGKMTKAPFTGKRYKGYRSFRSNTQ